MLPPSFVRSTGGCAVIMILTDVFQNQARRELRYLREFVSESSGALNSFHLSVEDAVFILIDKTISVCFFCDVTFPADAGEHAV